LPKWLTQEWLDENTRLAQSQPERPGATARLQYRITGGPGGDLHYYWIVRDGHLEENRLGILDDAEVTLVESIDDAMQMQKGELDPNTAFMQGKIKVEGDIAKLMALLPITMSPEFQAFQASVRDVTEY
jgi:putative sterol carrier protein